MIARIQGSSVRGLAPDEAASYWLVRLDAGPLDPYQQAEFEAWRAETPVNDAAFERAKSAWATFDHADGDPHLDALRDSALAVGAEPRRGLWLGVGAGIAASLLAVILVGPDLLSVVAGRDRAQSVTASGPPAVAQRPDRGEFVTATGERRTVDLADGSAITLNTDSAVRVSYASERRLVHLLRGQALFEVAKDHRRPFVVQAADREVTALGTVFEVRLDPDRMKVTLVEGKVVVDAVSDHPPKNGAVIVPTVLAAGQELVAMKGAPPQIAKVDVDKQLRWRDGFVEFNDVPLETAIREMNRYSSRQLILHDAATGSLRVSGVFRTGNPERFAAIVGELLPVRSRPLPDERIELSTASGPAR